MAATGKPEDYPMMDSVFKEFSESYNQANENWREPASEEETKVTSVAFKETLSETALKKCWLKSHYQKIVNLLRQNLLTLLFLLLCLLQ